MKRPGILLRLAMLPLLFAAAGCLSPTEELQPSDINLAELQQRIDRATDPERRYAEAATSVMRQEISDPDPGWFGDDKLKMVEVKTMRPDYFRLTTFEENEPTLALISNGESCWVADYRSKRVSTLSSEEFRRMRVLTEIARPGSRIDQIFSDIQLQLCRIGDREYYKLSCSNPGMNPLELYINRETYLTERVRGKLRTGAISSISYDSRLLGYSLYEGVRMPEETISTNNGEMQRSRVIYYKLNVPMDPAEFRPPVF